METIQSSFRIADITVLAVSILKLVVCTYMFRTERSKMGQYPPFALVITNRWL